MIPHIYYKKIIYFVFPAGVIYECDLEKLIRPRGGVSALEHQPPGSSKLPEPLLPRHVLARDQDPSLDLPLGTIARTRLDRMDRIEKTNE